MTEMPYATGTADAATAPDAGDTPRYDEAGPGGGYDGGADALAAEDQLPARQDSRNAAWGDSPEYDEDGLGDQYDGDLDALTGEDQLPARQDSRNAAWGESPEYDEAGLGGYDGDADALAAEDQLPARQDSRNAAWGDSPEYDLGGEYDGDLDALTAEDHALDSGQEDQDQTTADEASDEAAESSPAGADTGSAAETDTGERPDETAQAGQADALTRQAAQPDDAHADPDAAPDAGLKELKAEYEASLKDLKAEFQALKDLWGPVSDAPEGTGREADQPYAGDRKRTTARSDATEAKPEGDRPGLWSNAKTALYGAIGTTVTLAAADQFTPSAPHPVVDIATGAVTVIAALVPTLREGWKRKHDNPPD